VVSPSPGYLVRESGGCPRRLSSPKAKPFLPYILGLANPLKFPLLKSVGRR
jgi:hypothetical protein